MGSALAKFNRDIWSNGDNKTAIVYSNGQFDLTNYGDNRTGVVWGTIGDRRPEFMLDELLATVFRRDVFVNINVPKERLGTERNGYFYATGKEFNDWAWMPVELFP